GELRRPQCLLQNHVPIPRLHGLGDDVGGFLQLRLVPRLPLTCIQSASGLQQVGDVTLDESVHPFPLEGDALDAVSKLLKSAFQCRHQFSLPILTSSTSIRTPAAALGAAVAVTTRSEEHTSELQSREKLVCRLLLEKRRWSTSWN